MGYRSDVRLRTTREGYRKFKEIVTADMDEGEDILSYKENIKIEDKQVTITWSYMKWYPEFKEIQAFNKAIEYLCEHNIDFQFIRIGENIDDIEENYHINNGDIDDFYVIREFSD